MTCPRYGCGATAPHSHLPAFPPEVVRARQEDPGFGEVLGRGRAKARRTEYEPTRDYPYRPAGKSIERVDAAAEAKKAELIKRWGDRAPRINAYLRVIR